MGASSKMVPNLNDILLRHVLTWVKLRTGKFKAVLFVMLVDSNNL